MVYAKTERHKGQKLVRYSVWGTVEMQLVS